MVFFLVQDIFYHPVYMGDAVGKCSTDSEGVVSE